MATYTASAAQTNASGFFLQPPRYNEKGVQARSVEFNFSGVTSAISAGDVIQMIPVQRGAVVLDLNVEASSAAGLAYTMSVGDGGNAARYAVSQSANANAVVVFRAGGGIGYSYSVDDTIDIKITTATSATATGTVRLTLFIAYDNAPDGAGGQN